MLTSLLRDILILPTIHSIPDIKVCAISPISGSYDSRKRPRPVNQPISQLKVVPYGFIKSEKKCKFQPQKQFVDISEKNETKVMHSITFKASSAVNR